MPCPETELHPLVTRLSQRRALTDRERAAILALPHRVASVERNGFIAREGDLVTHCCLLLAGFACRHKATGDGARQMLSLHIAGDLVDLHNVLLEVADHNVQALTNARIAHPVAGAARPHRCISEPGARDVGRPGGRRIDPARMAA